MEDAISATLDGSDFLCYPYLCFYPRMPFWISKLIKQPREIGAIAPSSHFLGRAIADQLKPADRVLELGPGTGTITKEILTALNDPSKLICIEQEKELAKYCQKRFPDISIIHADAFAYLSEHKILYDTIVSGIPFTALPREKRQQWFQLIHDRLNPRGSFILFQYSRIVCNDLKTIFGNLDSRYVLINLPPAFVFSCKRRD